MRKSSIFVLALGLIVSGCISTPKSVEFEGKEVATFSITAGCKTLELDEDCSNFSGATRVIEISGIKLRSAGGDSGKIVFIMANSSMMPDQWNLRRGSREIENYLTSKDIEILETKVMYSNETLYGVHYVLNENGYQYIKELTVN